MDEGEHEFREFLMQTQEKLNAQEDQLLRIGECLTAKGLKLPPNFPELKRNRPNIIDIQPKEEIDKPKEDKKELEFVLKEPVLDESDLSDVMRSLMPNPFQEYAKSHKFMTGKQYEMINGGLSMDIKEPVFDESELSDVGKVILEAAAKGLPLQFSRSGVNKTVSKTFPKAKTPNSDTIQIRTVRHFFQSPAELYYSDRLKYVHLSSPELPTVNDPKDKIQNVIPEELQSTTEVKFSLAALKSPDDPELEFFHKVDGKQPLSAILQSPPEPEYSDFMKTLMLQQSENQTSGSPALPHQQ